jgi:hypothetical protein
MTLIFLIKIMIYVFNFVTLLHFTFQQNNKFYVKQLKETVPRCVLSVN